MSAPGRPHLREDGWPTRNDARYDTDAERLCRVTLKLAEELGASRYLTKAVTLLFDAREAIADHLEGKCYHCGKFAEPDGEHSCDCPYNDQECPNHPEVV